MTVRSPVRAPATKQEGMYDHNLNQFQEVTTKSSYYCLIDALLEADVISFDLETQSEAKGKKGNMEDWHPHSRVVSASFTVMQGDPSVAKALDSRETFFVPLSHPESPWTGKDKPWDADAPWRKVYTNLCKAMLKSGAKLSAHNGKYEVRWSYSMTGLALEDRLWWDTMMSAYLLDENESASLKPVAVKELGVEEWADVDLRDAEKVSLDALGLYNARDTDYQIRIVPKHKQRLLEEEPRLARIFKFHSMPLIRTLCRMEREGLPLDVEKTKAQQEVSKKIVKEKGDELKKYAAEELGMKLDDYPTISFTNSKFFTEFMARTKLPVISLTDTGNPSWSADNLETLSDMGHSIASTILEVRKHANRQSKFYTPWLRSVSQTGRLHPSFNPMLVDDKYDKAKGTKTGRLSSSGQLNAQQVARDIKDCFGGVEGWLVAELDYSQIELRIAAWLAQVERVIKAYERGEDLHVLMAAAVKGCDPSEVEKDDRQKGKAGNFGFLYDMGETTYIEYARTNYKVVVTPEESRKTRRAFFDVQWPGLAKWHDRQRTIVRKYGYVRNPIGRKRRLPEIHSGIGWQIGQAERRAINSPIQSFAADLMCLALVEIDRVMDPRNVRLIGTVHDSLLALVRDRPGYERDVDAMAQIMLNPGLEKKFGIKIGVPLEVESKVGYHWSSADAVERVHRLN